MPAAMLPLPDVAELVRDEVVGDVRVTEEDRPPERVAREAPEPRNPEEPGRDDDAHSSDRDRGGVVVERVEPGLRVLEREPEVACLGQLTTGVRTMIGLPFWPCT